MSRLNLPKITLEDKERGRFTLNGVTDELVKEVSKRAGVKGGDILVKKINHAIMSGITPETLLALIESNVINLEDPESSKTSFWSRISLYISITSDLNEVKTLLESGLSFKEIVELNKRGELDMEHIKFITRFR